MKYLLLFVPTVVIMLWVLCAEYRRKDVMGAVLLTLLTVVVLLRFASLAFYFDDIAMPAYFDAVIVVASLYTLPLMYAYLCDQCGTRWYNCSGLILFVLPLLLCFYNPVIMIGSGGLEVPITAGRNVLSVCVGDRIVAQVNLRSTIVVAQCLIVAVRMVVLWFRVRKYGLKFSSRLTRYYMWMFILLIVTAFVACHAVRNTDGPLAKWLFFGVYSVLLAVGYILVPNSFMIRPILTDSDGVPVKLDSFIRRNGALATALVVQLEENKIYLKPGLHIDDVAALIGTNRTYVSQIMRRKFGKSFVDYVNDARIAHAKQLLLTTSLTLGEVAVQSGFTSASTFCRTFKHLTGISPVAWKEQQSGLS